MTYNLSDVKGIGKKEDVLKEAGIDTVEKLASVDLDALINLKGIGKATAEKIIKNAKDLLEEKSVEDTSKQVEELSSDEIEKKAREEIEKLEEKKKRLQGKKVEKGDFILVKISGKTQRGKIFRVSSDEDAKKAGIFDEQKAKQGLYSPDFVIVGKPGFLNEGLTETIENMNYFEKKSVRIPPAKAFGKRDPKKIERIGIAKFRKLNEGKNPEIGQDFTKQTQGQVQRGTVTNVVQGRVIVDYNHPLAGQHLEYNLEIIDKIEDFNEKIEYFMISKGISKENVKDFKVSYNKKTKSLEIIIPKMFLFQNLAYFKFGIAMDLQTHMSEDIGDVKFIEIFEKIPVPPTPSESVKQKIEDYNKEKAIDNTQESKN